MAKILHALFILSENFTTFMCDNMKSVFNELFKTILSRWDPFKISVEYMLQKVGYALLYNAPMDKYVKHIIIY